MVNEATTCSKSEHQRAEQVYTEMKRRDDGNKGAGKGKPNKKGGGSGEKKNF